MPFPSPIAYPSPSLYPGFGDGDMPRMVALGTDLVLGATDPDGVRWTLNDIDGWPGSPGSTVQFSQRARAHGSTASEAFLKERVMTVSGHVHAPSAIALERAFERLSSAVKLEPFEMLVSEARFVRATTVVRQGEVLPKPLTDLSAHYSFIVTAEDPRRFGDVITATTSLPSSSGGLVRPSTWPRTWTGSSETGIITLHNPGNTAAPVWLQVDGSLLGEWSVTHQGQGRVFSSSLALAADEFVTVDMDRREILAQGQSARSGYVTSRGWFSLDPGDNDIAFSAQNYSADAQLTVATRPAWE